MKKNYIIGYILSLLLTLVAFVAVQDGWLSGKQLLLLIVVAASLQLAVQLYFFLHLQEEARPRWRLWAALFTAGTLAIVVGGSLWIMDNLNYNMLHDTNEVNEYMRKESNKGF